MFISIADLSLTLSGLPENFGNTTEPIYIPFVLPTTSSSKQSDIHLTVQHAPVDIPDGAKLSFDTNVSWKIFHKRDFLYITLQPPAFQQPFWVAKTNHNFTEISLIVNRHDPQHNPNRLPPNLLNHIHYPLDQILIMHHMARHKKGLIIHSAGIELQGKGYIFPGKSGAGKSTLTRQLAGQEYFELLSDDRMIVRKLDDDFRAFGTPWPGEAGIAVNKGVPLAGLFFIHHADENRVESLAPQRAVERLMPVSSIPWYDREAVINLLDFCDDLTSTVPAFDLYFKPTTEVADFFQSVTLP